MNSPLYRPSDMCRFFAMMGDFERLWNRVALTLVIDETRNDTAANYMYSAIARPSTNPPNPPPSLGGTNRPSSPPEVNWTSLDLTDDSDDSVCKWTLILIRTSLHPVTYLIRISCLGTSSYSSW